MSHNPTRFSADDGSDAADLTLSIPVSASADKLLPLAGKTDLLCVTLSESSVNSDHLVLQSQE